MSLSVAGVWQVGVWDQTTWADGVWREGAFTPVVADTTPDGGGGGTRKRKEEAARKRKLANARLLRNREQQEKIAEEIEQITRSNIAKDHARVEALKKEETKLLRAEKRAEAKLRLDRIKQEDEMLILFMEQRRRKILTLAGKLKNE